MTPEERTYVDRVACAEKVRRSAVIRRALRALKKSRHDYGTPLQALMLTADELERSLLNRRQTAARIRELVREMDAMRRVSEADEKEPLEKKDGPVE